ncbi:PAS domain-containing protein [Campylobacter fetus]|uniref:PAS sensor protein n=1 Tax=Campylobacter fetus subsp. testudinum TaxID=1507806 RepID=A0AAX0HD39_CAMFE|nr:PAS domain-containing protein [Campylobacter fetus]AGZ81853.1 PAS sensor-containing signal-transduction protein [Campylobacter fetus subsp. testudinum 03-427]AJB45587.1 PAS sensor protein [Campylobacter fetus subsp. testudinum]ALV65010.1 PAS sensor-containing signal-transduction protein [Campylobacter fetus subsp. testudinum Sp3]AVK81254.1 PAS domain S-box protein [Campylobacter fetus subsp. testudinum]EAI4322725.1 PAS domain-containing protein [Campylobacter fetus]
MKDSLGLFEKDIDEEAFIVSKTDLKGNITYCNQTFLEIVNLKNKDLIGKPHNLVRHPDMPKFVFKLLWERIKDKKEIFAFVKNRTFDGAYYWVYANITSSLDEHGNIIGYYSVRRKASKEAIKTVIPIYAKMVEIEKAKGVDDSAKYIKDFLASNNIAYDCLINNLQRSKG